MKKAPKTLMEVFKVEEERKKRLKAMMDEFMKKNRERNKRRRKNITGYEDEETEDDDPDDWFECECCGKPVYKDNAVIYTRFDNRGRMMSMERVYLCVSCDLKEQEAYDRE